MLWSSPGLSTVEEQRARLPPPQGCGDVIEGIWRSHSYYPRHAEWYVFSLTIARSAVAPNQLVGQTDVRVWTGPPSDPEPKPNCEGYYNDWVVYQPSSGTVNGLNLEFGGDSFTRGPVRCGHGPTGYLVDRFIGTIDPQIHEFQSINRWFEHGTWQEEATVFRRIQCLPTEKPVLIPPLLPPASSRSSPSVRLGLGCSR